MNTPAEMARDVGYEIAKAAPPVAMWALTPNTLVAIVTVAYVLLQSAFLIWKWRAEWRKRHDA